MAHTPNPRTPICRLTTEEALLVWAIRHWVQSVKARLDPRDLLRRGFAQVGAQDMTDPIDELLTITLHEATSVRDVGCVRCPALGDGERDILHAVALAQRGRNEAAIDVLETWLPPSAARLAHTQVIAIGHRLGADTLLPLRNDNPAKVWWAEVGWMDSVSTVRRGSAMVH